MGNKTKQVFAEDFIKVASRMSESFRNMGMNAKVLGEAIAAAFRPKDPWQDMVDLIDEVCDGKTDNSGT